MECLTSVRALAACCLDGATPAKERAEAMARFQQDDTCRLVARDTVEERILALQVKKRELADSILAGDESLLHTLTREDLEALLG